MPPLKIAVAGAGLMGRVHMDVIAQSDVCTLSAVVDPTDAAQAWAKAQGLPWFATLEALLASTQPDGVVLATPNAMHAPQALQCMQAHVPVLVEKPVAHTVEQAKHLVQVAEAGQAKVLVGHHRAHSPIMALAKEVVQSGQLGRLVSVMGSALFYKPEHYFDDAPWRREAGGGPMLINLIHDIHNLRMLCGDIVSVQAISSNAVRGFPVEDTASINFRFANGALGAFMLSDTAASARSWEQTSQENKSYSSYDDEDCYVIVGTQGSLAVPTMRLKTYARTEDRSWWKPFEVSRLELHRIDPLVVQMAHFADVIRGQSPPLVSARDGLQNLLVVEAITQAAQTGREVQVTS